MLKKKVELLLERIRQMNGDPHYVALGMAIGVFVAVTPTIPFHTVLAIGLSILLRGSKAAAILGVWASNPVTVVFLYVASYKTGHLFFDDGSGGINSIKMLIHSLESDMDFSLKVQGFLKFARTQLNTFLIMNFGGVLLGIPSGLVAYAATFRLVKILRKRKIDRKTRRGATD